MVLSKCNGVVGVRELRNSGVIVKNPVVRL